MGRTRAMLDDSARRFMAAQHIFFVLSAPLDASGHINVSPRGLDAFRMLGRTTVAYIDFNGSGVETMACLQENGSIVLMFCAFQGPPNIFRLYGRGRAVEPHPREFAALAENFPGFDSLRSIIVVELTRVTDSCGYGVPLFSYEGEGEPLTAWARKKGPEELKAYCEQKNEHRIDGLPGTSEPNHQEVM